MTNLGTPVRGKLTVEDLLRTVLNKILESEIKQTAIKSSQPLIGITLPETLLISHTEPVITFTTNASALWDNAPAQYDFVEYV